MNKDERIKQYNEFMIFNRSISVDDLKALGYFEKPASLKYHGIHDGGLFDHSLEVAKILVDLTEKLNLKWERDESPYIIGLYHDICKCDDYLKHAWSGDYHYNNLKLMPGHAEKSIIMIQKYINLTDEEIACIRWHMGAYETDPKMWEYYGRAIEKYPNVLYTHTADMIASKIRGI